MWFWLNFLLCVLFLAWLIAMAEYPELGLLVVPVVGLGAVIWSWGRKR